jgi:hypothetical protein
MTSSTATTRALGPDLVRMLAALGWVVAATAATLAGLGALPGWIAGEPHEVRNAATLELAERGLGTGLALPSYFPSHLGWPPARIRVAGGKGGAIELTFRERTGGDQLQLLQATTPGVALPPVFDPPGSELSSSATTVAGRPARLTRWTIAGQIWHQLAWERDGCQMVLRTRGDVEELFRIARSAHRRGTP